MRQQLKINGIWAVLPANFKVTIKRTNPLFNTEGDFSFPFNLSVAENRAIIQSAADPHGRFALRRLNGLPVEYWFDGQLLFRGYTEVKSSVQFKDTISLNFVSGIKSITQRVKDMKANEVSVERMQIGYACTGIKLDFLMHGEVETRHMKISTGQANFVGVDMQRYNVLSMPYESGFISAPVKNALYFDRDKMNLDKDSRTYPFCNTRVAMSYDETDSDDKVFKVLSFDRRDAAPCMFVLYWLKRLFMDLNVSYTNEFEDMEDMCRLAFFSVFPKYSVEHFSSAPIQGAEEDYDRYSDNVDYYADWTKWSGVLNRCQFDFGKPYWGAQNCNIGKLGTKWGYQQDIGLDYSNRKLNGVNVYDEGYQESGYHDFASDHEAFSFRPAYLSGQQYPEQKVQTIIDDLHNIFGLRIIYDTVTNHARVCYIKDIMHNTPTKTLPCEFVGEPLVTRALNPGIIVTYGKERKDDDTEAAAAVYDYDMPAGIKDASGQTVINPAKVVAQSYAATISTPPISTDTTTYYDRLTCNAHRVMVDKDSEKNDQGAQYFEAGAWNDYRQNVTDEENAQSIKASFEPVGVRDVSKNHAGNDIVPYVDAEQAFLPDMMYETLQNIEENRPEDNLFWNPTVEKMDRTLYQLTKIGFFAEEITKNQAIFSVRHSYAATGELLYKQTVLLKYASNNGECCDMTASDSPLQKWQDDGHYVLGFMRGPGNDGHVAEDADFNADGTKGWNTVVGTPTFTADSVDQFGNVFDYNGSAAGGIDQSQRLSLKLEARKVFGYDEDGNPDFYPCDNEEIAKRGVVAKMLGEYLYFMANKNTVTHRASVAIGAVMNIDWCAYYPMQGVTGFINSIQLELSENGVGEATIEQYAL